jgi:hypothetical protein
MRGFRFEAALRACTGNVDVTSQEDVGVSGYVGTESEFGSSHVCEFGIHALILFVAAEEEVLLIMSVHAPIRGCQKYLE